VTEQVYTPSCPERVVKAAVAALGRSVWNPQGQTRHWLERYCGHAIGVWVSKYGALSDDQQDYAWGLFVWAIENGAKTGGVTHRHAHIGQNFTRLVNDERVDAGMKRRAPRRRSLVDTDGLMVAA
jgi:hypothetical protein